MFNYFYCRLTWTKKKVAITGKDPVPTGLLPCRRMSSTNTLAKNFNVLPMGQRVYEELEYTPEKRQLFQQMQRSRSKKEFPRAVSLVCPFP